MCIRDRADAEHTAVVLVSAGPASPDPPPAPTSEATEALRAATTHLIERASTPIIN